MSIMIASVSTLTFLFTSISASASTDEDYTTLPNSCAELEDGEHWLKLLDDTSDTEYPAINVLCQNGYAILDYNHDTNIDKYFSSFNYWHYGVVGPSPNNRVNWQEWFLPFESDNTKFALSPDCNQCQYDEEWQVYDDQTTYWMTGNTFQCWWSVKGVGECEMDYFTYQCYECAQWQDNNVASYREEITYDVTDPKIWRMCGECVHAVKPSFSKTPQNHDECQAYSFEGTFQPSLGVDGRYCMCTQQSNVEYYKISNEKLNEYKTSFDEITKIKTQEVEVTRTSENTIIELYQSDFDEGTYRILSPGTYKIMEDIIFDFNKLDDNFNDPTNGWFPLDSQQDKYPGAGQYRDNYFLGFFAGITIESDDVVLDLNGFELKQSKAFYYAQRWFSIVELASAMFLPGQGNGFFGNEFSVATNTHIKNGILGLTSHFGIHGNNNVNIYIEDVQIRDFETHGIHMNWFENVNINNVEIGPASKIVYLKPEYGEARYLLPRLRYLGELYPNKEMEFYGRNEKVTINDIADELQLQLEYAFWYAMGAQSEDPDGTLKLHDRIDFDSGSWKSAKKLFINNEGMTSTSGLHGIFLNTIASPVLFTYRLSTEEYSKTANIENVKIHGLTHAMDEWIRFHHYGEEIWWNAFMGPLDARSAIDNLDVLDENIKYKGDVVIDAYIALNYLGYDNWDILGRQAVGDGTLVNWALGTNTDLANNNAPYTLDIDNILIGCNCDAQLHSGKGVLGLRIDSVQDVTIKNVEVYELEDVTPLGLEACGAYEKFNIWDNGSHRGGGHFVQRPPMQTGFSGNMVQGISIASSKNVVIEDVHTHDFISHTGQTFGVSIWPGNENVELKGSIKAEYMMAGLEVNSHELGIGYKTQPNAAPEACGTRVVYEYSKSTSEDPYITTLSLSDDAVISTMCVSGEVGCSGSVSNYEHTVEGVDFGEDSSSMNSLTQCRDPISAVDKLNSVLEENGEKITMTDLALGDSENEQHSWQKSVSTGWLFDEKKAARGKGASEVSELIVGNNKESVLEVVAPEDDVDIVDVRDNSKVNRGLFGLSRLESGVLVTLVAIFVLGVIYVTILRRASKDNENSEMKMRLKSNSGNSSESSDVQRGDYYRMTEISSGTYGAV